MNNYLIPANAKKSTLILGFFTPLDLIVFGTGVVFTLILLLIIQTSEFNLMILILLPALISTTLVLPILYYHNVLQLLTNIFTFYSSKRKYKWKGWCVRYEESDK